MISIIVMILLLIFCALALLEPGLILPLIFFIISTFILIYSKRKLGTWLNLFSLISVVYIFGFIIRYISLIYGYNHFDIPQKNMTITLIYSFGIYILFIIGCLFGFNIKTTSHYIIFQTNKFETQLIIFINLVITVGNFFLLLLVFGGWSGLVSNFSDKSTSFAGMGVFFVFLSSLAISLIILLSIGSIKLNFKTIILIIISLIPLISTGGRILLVLTAFSYILSYEFFYRKIRLKQLIIFGLLGLGFYLAYFSYFRVYNLTGNWDYLFNNMGDLYYNTLVNGALSFIDGLNVIMFYVPNQVGYLGGYSLVAGLLIFVPSFIISNKPDNTAFLYNQVFNQSQFSNGTGQNPSLIGEIYWNLGPLNTLVIFFLIGISVGIIYKKAYTVNFNPRYISVFVLIFAIPLVLFILKSGISSGTPYRIIIPLVFNFTLLFLLNKIGRRKKNV